MYHMYNRRDKSVKDEKRVLNPHLERKDFVVTVKDNKVSTRLASHVDNGWSIVMIYADWCGHCNKQKPIYSKLYEYEREFRKNPINLFAIDGTFARLMRDPRKIEELNKMKQKLYADNHYINMELEELEKLKESRTFTKEDLAREVKLIDAKKKIVAADDRLLMNLTNKDGTEIANMFPDFQGYPTYYVFNKSDCIGTTSLNNIIKYVQGKTTRLSFEPRKLMQKLRK